MAAVRLTGLLYTAHRAQEPYLFILFTTLALYLILFDGMMPLRLIAGHAPGFARCFAAMR